VTISAIVMAAGKGTRMKSELPKPLHQARGRSMLAWVIHALEGAEPEGVAIVVGHGSGQVKASLDHDFDRQFVFAEQLTQRGTGDAAAVGLSALDVHDNSFSDDDHVIVVPGDTPLLRSETIAEFVASHLASGAAATLLTATLDDPTNYGRVLRSANGQVSAVVEQRDGTAEQLAVSEVNTSIYCFRRSLLAPALRLISTDNAQGEMYLTDAIGVLADAGHPIEAFEADATEVTGVNDRAQLTFAAEHLGRRIATAHMLNGVTIVQPSSTVIDASVTIEPDAIIHAATVLAGATTIGAGAVVGPSAHLVDATIGAGAVVESSRVDGATVAPDDVIGPFAQLPSN